jgi:cytochrome c biogenesis protein CcdA
VENNQLSSYFISLVTVFSLVIAAFATISSIINSDQTIYLVIFTGILVVTLAAYFMADLTTKTYNANLMERHLIVIRIVIQEKEKELQLEELRKQESKKLRESRLRKNIKSTPKDA